MKNILKIAAVVLLLWGNVKAQNSRWDYVAMTTTGSGQAVPLLAIPGAGVTFYSCTAGVCTTLANTYPSASSGTPCPTTTQVVPALSTSCVATADTQGNFGAWFQAGQYAYTLTIGGYPYGPYPFTIGGGGSGGSGTVGSGTAGQFAQYGSSGTTVGGVTASGDLSLAVGGAFTFNSVNSSPGPCGDATHVCQVTVNGKGLTTGSAPVAISFPGGGPALQTNGVNNSIQTLLNLQPGPGISITNPSGGDVYITNTGTAPNFQTGGVNNSNQTLLNFTVTPSTGIVLTNPSGGIENAAGVVFGASGSSHAQGMVPDPGATAGTTHYLREDGTWAVLPQGSASQIGVLQCGTGTTCASGVISAGPSISNTGLIADYSFNAASGTVLTDNSGNGNNGTLGGTTLPTWTGTGLSFVPASNVSLPSALNAGETWMMAVYFNPVSLAPNVAPGAGTTYNYSTYQMFVSSSLGTTGYNFIMQAPGSTGGTFGAPGVYSNTQCQNSFSGWHVLSYVLGTGSGNNDTVYIDGNVCGQYSKDGASAGAQTSGNTFFGGAGVSPWTGQTGTWTAYRARVFNRQLGAAEIAGNASYMKSEVSGRGVVTDMIPNVTYGPQLICRGDSITQGVGGGVTPFCYSGQMTLNQPWTLQNWGTGGGKTTDLIPSDPASANLECNSQFGQQNAYLVFDGTNDASANTSTAGTRMNPIWQNIAAQIQHASAAGCVVTVSTMLSRGGNDSGGNTMDSDKDLLNTLIRQNALAAGASFITDFAANPLMGADGASANTTYFLSSDHVHPTQAGYTLMDAEINSSFNSHFGASPAAPTIITTSTYTMLPSDGYVNVQPSANTTLTLPDCLGQSGMLYRINFEDGLNLHTLTLQNSITAEPINGADYSSTGLVVLTGAGTLTLRDVANPSTSAGCHWDYLPGTPSIMRGLGWGFGDVATSPPLTTSEVGYYHVPAGAASCRITGWHIAANTGTVTIKTARVNGGTSLPTLGSNSISTSGVSLSTGTIVDSTTVTDFTSTTINANDWLGFFITALSGSPAQVTFSLDCAQ